MAITHLLQVCILVIVMKTGHPRANFGPPTPAPTNIRTRRYGCGIPVNTGVGSRHSRGFANGSWVSITGQYLLHGLIVLYHVVHH